MKRPEVQYAEPINYEALMRQASAAASQQYRDQMRAMVKFYPQMEQLQLGTVQKLADNLDNPYTQQARGAINQGLDQRGNITGEADRLSGMGGLMGDFALQNYLASGPTDAERAIQLLGQSAMGVQADQIVAPGQDAVRNVQAGQVAAAQMGNVGQAASRDISAGQVGQGAIGQALMDQALRRAQSDGRLSPEAERDAVQSARAGMAARGMATGSAGLAAELLNRDRYARGRQAEDLAFAQGVQGQDLGRQFQNVGNQMAADQSNQGAALQAELANLQTRLNSAVQQGNWQQAAAIQNQQANLQASMANQSRDQFLTAAGMDAQQANQSANMNQREMNRAFMLNANQAFNQGTIQRRDQAAQQAALGANIMQSAAGQYGNAANIGFAGAQNMLAADPYGRALGVGLQSAGNTQANLQSGIGQTYGNAMGMAGNVASFNANLLDTRANSQLNNWASMEAARMQAGAASQAGTMGMIGSGVGMAVGIGAIAI